MKSGLRAILNVACLALCLICGLVTAQAQDREKYVISAKAGGVNMVSGDVTVRHEGTQREETLAARDDLQSGDIVSTGVGGRVEVLLNPGSYMRVSESAEFELTDASLDSLQVKLRKGSAIFEVASADDIQMSINILTPQSNVQITRGGIYRFNVLPNETTEIFVRKGKLILGRGAENQVKSGQKVVMRNGRLEVAKFDKKEQDALDLWSKDRAKMLARANEQLQARNLVAAFRNLSAWDPFGTYSTTNYGFGAWVYSPRFNSYCFYPSGGRHWSSPYGHGYTNGSGWGGVTNPGYLPPGSSGGSGGSTGSTGSGGNGGGNGGGNSGGNNPSPPPPTSPPPMPSVPPPMAQPPSPPMREVEPAPRREYTREP